MWGFPYKSRREAKPIPVNSLKANFLQMDSSKFKCQIFRYRNSSPIRLFSPQPFCRIIQATIGKKHHFPTQKRLCLVRQRFTLPCFQQRPKGNFQGRIRSEQAYRDPSLECFPTDCNSGIS